MKISRIPDSNLEARVQFDSSEELDLAYPNRIGLMARKVLQAAHVVQPPEFPLVRVLTIEAMYRRERELTFEQHRLEDKLPETEFVVAALSEFRLNLGA